METLAIITRNTFFYLQQDHQQFSVVSVCVPTDVLLQFSTKLWRKEEDRSRGAHYLQLQTAVTAVKAILRQGGMFGYQKGNVILLCKKAKLF